MDGNISTANISGTLSYGVSKEYVDNLFLNMETKLKNIANDVINPATEEKQDDLISEIHGGYKIPVDYYLYQMVATPTLTSNVNVGDTIINIDSNSGVTNGNVITFYESDYMYQSLVVANTSTTITVGSPIDNIYTITGSTIESGLWNMAVDGSSTTQKFKIKSPPLSDLCIHTINFSMLDNVVMDDGKFGGITALSNGIIFAFTNGLNKNLALVVNNLGLWEIGFTLDYSDKAPAGQYGLRARKNLREENGTRFLLRKGLNSEFQLFIQDDLSELDLVSVIIGGHIN